MFSTIRGSGRVSDQYVIFEAEAELRVALEQLRAHPVPIVTWKIYAALGRLRSHLGEVQSANAAFAEAASIIDSILQR